MATGRVTKGAVDALQAGARNVFLWDTRLRGFGVKVTPSGAKTYVYQYRLGGRGSPTRRYTIGRHGDGLPPDLARERAEKLAAKVVHGIDPLEEERAERAERAGRVTFRDAAKRFVETHVAANWKSAPEAASRPLRLHVTPVLGAKPLAEIKRADVAAMLDRIPIEQVALRRTVYAVTSKLFAWAVARGEIESSPLDKFEAPPLPASRDRVLSEEELRYAWKATAGLEYPFGPLYRILILTGQRRDEVAGLRWAELDRAGALWRLPKERAKNAVASDVHLTARVVAELDALAGCDGVDEAERKWPRRGLIFTTTGKTPVSGFSRAKRRWDAEIRALIAKERKEPAEQVTVPRWVVHDLRRTLATGLQRLGIRFEVTEAVLNHVSGARSGVAGVYQRYGWEAEKRAALEAWARHVDQLLTESDATNVVPMARQR